MERIKKFAKIFLIFIFLTSCKTSINQDDPNGNLEENIIENSMINLQKNILKKN